MSEQEMMRVIVRDGHLTDAAGDPSGVYAGRRQPLAFIHAQHARIAAPGHHRKGPA
jgi:hypothetical protein